MADFLPNGVEIQSLLKKVRGGDEDDANQDNGTESKAKLSNGGGDARYERHQPEEEENFCFTNISTCWICNGYYGGNFGETLCPTCHAFLYHTQEPDEILTTLSDDEDSGNDEPPFKDKHDDDEGVQDAVSNENHPFRNNENNNNLDDVDVAVDDDDVVDDNLDEEEDAGMVEPHQRPQRERNRDNDVRHNVDDDDEYNDNSSNSEQEGDLVQNVENAPNLAGLRPYPHPVMQNAANHRYMLPIQRPRPPAPLALSHYVELLSDPRANAQEALAGSRNDAVDSQNILSLPVEITIIIFSYLDDISLWRVSTVCKTWENIISQNTAMCMWKKYLKERWPLFKSVVRNVPNYFKLYSALMASCFCRTCFLEMALIPTGDASLNHIRAQRLRADLRLINNYIPEGIAAIPLDKDNTYWQASILGPAGSPYEGGKFFLIIYFPECYPMQPPTVRFVTKILHPNVSRHGDVGIDIIQHNWSLALNISKLLLSLQSLLTDPYTEVCMEPELGYMYDNDRKRFEKLARQWTWRWAMFELMPPR